MPCIHMYYVIDIKTRILTRKQLIILLSPSITLHTPKILLRTKTLQQLKELRFDYVLRPFPDSGLKKVDMIPLHTFM